MEDDACEDDTPPDYKLPIESRLVKCLRLRRADPHALTTDGRPVLREIEGLLERYINVCLSYGPENLQDWWSDGVMYLEIDEPVPYRFKLLGVTWVGCEGIAPFEIDVVLEPESDACFAKTVFRIGMLDERRCPQISDRNLIAQLLLEMRPRCNRDWAMAVELTSPSEPSDNREPE